MGTHNMGAGLLMSAFICAGLASATLAVLVLVFDRLLTDRRLEEIPGPRGWPVIGHGYQLPTNAAEAFGKWALQYGDIFKLRVGYYNWVVINTPEAIHEILEKQSAHTSSKAPSPMSHETVTGGHRMPTMPYDSTWRAMRSLVRDITAVPITASFVPCQEFETKQLLFDLLTNNAGDRLFYQHSRRYALSIINTNAFGRRVRSLQDPAALIAIESQAILRRNSRPGGYIVDEIPILARLPKWIQPGRRRADAAAAQIWNIKYGLWKRFEKDVEAGVAPFCYAREVYMNRHSWYERGLTEAHLVWLTTGLVEAGFETTSATLNTLIRYLAADQKIQQRAREELLDVVGRDRLPSYSDIPKLPYLRACLREALRINPILSPGIKHFVTRDITYKGAVIPQGTILLANTAFLHFDPRRFADPTKFNPERYLHHDLSSADYAALGDPQRRDHFTFSSGRRTCPGARLAENSLHIALAGILWAFKIHPVLDAAKNEVPMAPPGPDEYLDAGFKIPKPFAVRFVPVDQKTERVVREEWKRAAAEGYMLRGTPVDLNGMVEA